MGIHDLVELVMSVTTISILFYFILFRRSHLIGPIRDIFGTMAASPNIKA